MIIPKLTVAEMFKVESRFHGENVMIIDDGKKLKRKEAAPQIRKLAEFLTANDIKRGDVVMISDATERYETILVFLAANQIGAITCIVDGEDDWSVTEKYLDLFSDPHEVAQGHFEPEEKVKHKRIGRVKALFSNKTLPELYEKDLDDYGLETIVTLQKNQDNTGAIGYYSFENVLEMDYQKRAPRRRFCSEDLALITFTSGSTSGPKPMTFTNRALLAASFYTKAQSKIELFSKTYARYLTQVKFDCPYGFWISVMTPMLGGATAVLAPKNSYLEAITNERPDVISGTPALIEKMLEEEKGAFDKLSGPILDSAGPFIDLSSVKIFISGGERLEGELNTKAKRLFLRYGGKVPHFCNGYGVGEALGCVSTTIGSKSQAGTVGKVCKGMDVQILDPEMFNRKEREIKVLPRGKAGILAVRGENLLAGFVDRPDLDQRFIKIKNKLYISTGDLGTVRKDGYVSLLGRGEFFINNEPAKVYFEVVRGAFKRLPFVADSAVEKKKNPEKRYVPAVFLVINRDKLPNAAAKMTDKELKKWIIELAREPYLADNETVVLKKRETPRVEDVYLLEKLPRNKRTGKLDLQALKKMTEGQEG